MTLIDEHTKYLEQGLILREKIEEYISEKLKLFCKRYQAHFISGNGVWGCQIKVSVSNNVDAVINLHEVFSPVEIYNEKDWQKGGTGWIEKEFSPKEWTEHHYIEPEAIFYKACEEFQDILKEVESLSNREHPAFKFLLENLGDFGEKIKE